MAESLKAARERHAAEIYDACVDMHLNQEDVTDHSAIQELLRITQKQAMEALADYMRGHAGGTDTAIAALLDGPAQIDKPATACIWCAGRKILVHGDDPRMAVTCSRCMGSGVEPSDE